ncbi:MAG: carboxypeptidase-like regulatory domain-containing protein [Ignavibacteriales bacterium]|nr:carboxypeptidase-like regulatory domain-containing protein [Ignavibacteriales bacterium]
MIRNLVVFLLLSLMTFGQNVKISGKIHEENTGKVIENVMVYSVNFQKSTFSDKDGNYEITLPTAPNYTLKFLFYRLLSSYG